MIAAVSRSTFLHSGRRCLAFRFRGFCSTIFALASAAGRAGVAVIRVSGPESKSALQQLTNRPPPPPRYASVRTLVDQRGKPLDESLVLWFPGPRSYTGQDMCELHVHGGRAVVADVLETLGWCAGLRLAEPGEFTRRAFENGRMDLTQVEGLADLLQADTSAQRQQAISQLQGALGRLYSGWAERLTRALAYMEASIDFGDAEDLGDGITSNVVKQVMALRAEMAAHLNDGGCGERLRDGLDCVIVGPPNAGKSSLLNLIAQRPAALVSPSAGTTRDLIEVPLNLGGWPVTLVDSAGLRTVPVSDDANMRDTYSIEGEGIERARLRATAADILVAVFDVTAPLAGDNSSLSSHTLELLGPGSIAVLNKCDLVLGPAALATSAATTPSTVAATTGRQLMVPEQRMMTEQLIALERHPLIEQNKRALERRGVAHSHIHLVSCTSGAGISELLLSLQTAVRRRLEIGGEDEDGKTDGSSSSSSLSRTFAAGTAVITRQRHRNHLAQCVMALDSFSDVQQSPDMACEVLRSAVRSLGRITGRVDVEQLLDVIFRDFCIGK